MPHRVEGTDRHAEQSHAREPIPRLEKTRRRRQSTDLPGSLLTAVPGVKAHSWPFAAATGSHRPTLGCGSLRSYGPALALEPGPKLREGRRISPPKPIGQKRHFGPRIVPPVARSPRFNDPWGGAIVEGSTCTERGTVDVDPVVSRRHPGHRHRDRDGQGRIRIGGRARRVGVGARIRRYHGPSVTKVWRALRTNRS